MKPGQACSQHKHDKQFSTRHPSNATTNNRVFIGNLHPRVSKAHLEKLFLLPCVVGKLSSTNPIRCTNIQLCFHANGKPRGFAFCDFETQHDAVTVISALQGRTLLSRPLIVQMATPTSNHDPAHRASHSLSWKSRARKPNGIQTPLAASSTPFTPNPPPETATATTSTTIQVNSGNATAPSRHEKRQHQLEDQIAKLKRAISPSPSFSKNVQSR